MSDDGKGDDNLVSDKNVLRLNDHLDVPWIKNHLKQAVDNEYTNDFVKKIV